MTSVDVEDEIARASALLDDGRVAEAAVAYARCEQLLSQEKSPRRAEVLCNLARLARAHVGAKDAAGLLDLALAIFPAHRGAIAERMGIARELEEHAVAAMLGLRAFNFAEGDGERVAVLEGVVRDALEAAAGALRAALQIRRGDRALFQRMRALHEAAGEYGRAADVAVAIAETIGDPIERARAFVDAADLCAERAGNVDRAVALYEAAIADDPAVPGAFEAIEQVLLDSGDVEGTERAYVRQLERLVGHSEDARAKLLHKLAAIREDRLADWQGAAAALDQLVTLRPRDADARVHLARLLEDHDQDGLAVRCLEIGAAAAPKHAPTFRALHRVSRKRNDLDRAFGAAAVLVHHEEAEPEEQAHYRANAPRLALTPQHALDDAALAMLAPDDHDPVVAAIVSAIADAAVAMRLEQLKAQKQLPKLNPNDRQDLEKSTVSAVRTVGWAARFFAIKTPAIFARPGEPYAFAHLPAVEPSLGLGDSALSGRSVPELAYLLGYELATFRSYGRVLAFYPALNDLKTLVVAGISVVLQSEVPAEVAGVRNAIAPRLDAVQRLKIQTAVKALSERGGQLDVLRFTRAVERMACRAGLLACGDVNVAAHQIAMDGRVIGGLTAADRVRDLIGFSVSEPYARLRAALGIAVR